MAWIGSPVGNQVSTPGAQAQILLGLPRGDGWDPGLVQSQVKDCFKVAVGSGGRISEPVAGSLPLISPI